MYHSLTLDNCVTFAIVGGMVVLMVRPSFSR